jgi:hypothetical protein
MTSGRPVRWPAAVATVVAVAAAVRLARSRHRRSLHPRGRSFTGELRIAGTHRPLGAALLDDAATHPVTLRVSKAVGMRGELPDVRGLAIRIHLPGRDFDLLLDSTGRRIRHFPLPRRTFNTPYGTITSYRTGQGRKVYLSAQPDPHHAGAEGGRFVLSAGEPLGEVTVGRRLPPEDDAALAFDPVRNSLPDLHPTGFVHGTRALAYRWSQRWRGVTPADRNPSAVTRTAANR